jgi:hypothetical protein
MKDEKSKEKTRKEILEIRNINLITILNRLKISNNPKYKGNMISNLS